MDRWIDREHGWFECVVCGGHFRESGRSAHERTCWSAPPKDTADAASESSSGPAGTVDAVDPSPAARADANDDSGQPNRDLPTLMPPYTVRNLHGAPHPACWSIETRQGVLAQQMYERDARLIADLLTRHAPRPPAQEERDG